MVIHVVVFVLHFDPVAVNNWVRPRGMDLVTPPDYGRVDVVTPPDYGRVAVSAVVRDQ